MINFIDWVILLVTSIIVAVSENTYKKGSSDLIRLEPNILTYFLNKYILFSWFVIFGAKIVLGIPYANLPLSVVVPAHHLIVAVAGSMLGVLFFKEKISSKLVLSWLLSILSVVFFILGGQ